jgi:hypothetical protein
MIYNLAEWLRTQFPAETIYVNERNSVAGAQIPDRNVLLIENQGEEKPWTLFGFTMVQVLARDENQPDARALAWDIFTYMTSRWGQELPAVTIGGVVHPKVTIAQVSSVARPQSIGEDEEGRSEFSTNFKVYWGRR